MSNDLIQRAEDFRRQGHTYKEIADVLNIPRSTIYGWIQNIELTNDENTNLVKRQYQAKLKQVYILAGARKQETLKRNLKISAEASQIVKEVKLSISHKMILCALLFWCEGEKSDGSGVRFINSDPILVTAFLKLFRDSFEVKEKKFRALVHLHDYHDTQKQISFWSEITNIPVAQFHKPYLKSHSGKRIHEGYQGSISIRYQDAYLGKLLKMIYTQFSAQL